MIWRIIAVAAGSRHSTGAKIQITNYFLVCVKFVCYMILNFYNFVHNTPHSRCEDYVALVILLLFIFVVKYLAYELLQNENYKICFDTLVFFCNGNVNPGKEALS